MLVGLAIIIWSVRYVHKPYGPLVYLLLFITLFLVGGGIGQVVFFIPAAAIATRIHKPLTWWQNVLPPGVRKGLASAWRWVLMVASLLILTALVIAIFGNIPGVSDMDQVLAITLSMVGASLGFFLLAFLAGFAYDIERSRESLSTKI